VSLSSILSAACLQNSISRAAWLLHAIVKKITINNAMAKIKALRCPTCRTIVLPKDEDFPFCSDRCRRIDLGKWASGDYKISSPIQDPDDLEELARSNMQNPHKDEDAD
jgi:hypothetical protein